MLCVCVCVVKYWLIAAYLRDQIELEFLLIHLREQLQDVTRRDERGIRVGTSNKQKHKAVDHRIQTLCWQRKSFSSPCSLPQKIEEGTKGRREEA